MSNKHTLSKYQLIAIDNKIQDFNKAYKIKEKTGFYPSACAKDDVVKRLGSSLGTRRSEHKNNKLQKEVYDHIVNLDKDFFK